MTIRIGVVGLGGIAQKAWLPVLSQARAWQLVGAFSPNQANAQVVCERYRIPCFSTLNALAAACDAVFVCSYQYGQSLRGRACTAAGGKRRLCR